MKRIGFTGTRRGMTMKQLRTVELLLLDRWIEPIEVHHGDCIGADAEFHAVCKHLDIYRFVVHPPTDSRARAFVEGADETRAPYPYLVRNMHIVAAIDELFAAPAEYDEQPRGGTWSTIRHARKLGKPVVVVLPDGRVAGAPFTPPAHPPTPPPPTDQG